mmetsp:Transcript_4357/g.6415  ORF Transcript_4357/g.6415 Transcript_4357/m.6415 type:complete len:84 (-) Transcript_4357:2639-2890(-)
MTKKKKKNDEKPQKTKMEVSINIKEDISTDNESDTDSLPSVVTTGYMSSPSSSTTSGGEEEREYPHHHQQQQQRNIMIRILKM